MKRRRFAVLQASLVGAGRGLMAIGYYSSESQNEYIREATLYWQNHIKHQHWRAFPASFGLKCPPMLVFLIFMIQSSGSNVKTAPALYTPPAYCTSYS